MPLTFSLLFSLQKCNITGRVNVVGHGIHMHIYANSLKTNKIQTKSTVLLPIVSLGNK